MIISTSQLGMLHNKGILIQHGNHTGISRSMFPESLEMCYEWDWNIRMFPYGITKCFMGLEYLPINNPYHPWSWRIYLHEWLIFMVNVGRYTLPYMDAMGYINMKHRLYAIHVCKEFPVRSIDGCSCIFIMYFR